MGLLGRLGDRLLGNDGAVSSARNIVTSAGEAVERAANAIRGVDPELERQIVSSMTQLASAQIDLAKAESQHRSLFVAGWRPWIGWTLGISLFFFFVPQYVAASIMWVRAVILAGELVAYPVSADGLFELVLGMLGLGALRTYEKSQGIQGRH